MSDLRRDREDAAAGIVVAVATQDTSHSTIRRGGEVKTTTQKCSYGCDEDDPRTCVNATEKGTRDGENCACGCHD